MSVKVTFGDKLRESMRLHGEFFRDLNVLAGAALVIGMLVLIPRNPVMMGELLVLMTTCSIMAGSLLPGTSQSARRRKVRETRAGMLEKNNNVLEILSLRGRKRYDKLSERVSRLAERLPGDRDAVVRPGEYLLWLYLKLLMALDHLDANSKESSLEVLETERSRLEVESDDPGISEASRQVKQQTIQLLEQRITAARMRTIRVEEVESDLLRIDHQLALLCDRAAQQSPLADAGFRIDLATETVATSLCGDLPGGVNVQEMEEIFHTHLTS